eukprot:CAMPEP_0118666578 /NCGR_PEP_ID=MMETSP0785-20121206/19294_1 /TAXON_ID=91992 /ORGANISM="Bolidomonas pacifica, Strain CCMP 1866" /LENGTH=53 /DNA_ID=CAMNT_0006560907 /DNA_START=33 /DNA_END=194 /DNA_ORIENTATION=-
MPVFAISESLRTPSMRPSKLSALWMNFAGTSGRVLASLEAPVAAPNIVSPALS